MVRQENLPVFRLLVIWDTAFIKPTMLAFRLLVMLDMAFIKLTMLQVSASKTTIAIDH